MGGWVKKLTHYDRGGREVGSDSLASFVQHGVELPLAPTSDRPRQPMLNRGPDDLILQCISQDYFCSNVLLFLTEVSKQIVKLHL